MARDYVKQSVRGALKYLKRPKSGYTWDVPNDVRALIDYNKISSDIQKGMSGQTAARMEIQRVSTLQLDSGVTVTGTVGTELLKTKTSREREINLLTADYIKAGGSREYAEKAQAFQKVDLGYLRDVESYLKPADLTAREMRDYRNYQAMESLWQSFDSAGTDDEVAFTILKKFDAMTAAQKQVFFTEDLNKEEVTSFYGSNDPVIRTHIQNIVQKMKKYVTFTPEEEAVINDYADIIDPNDIAERMSNIKPVM